MAKVSVIIPLYKSAPYITETLDSVLQQTHADLEVLCVDDCSPDNTAEIVRNIAQKDKRVKYLAHSQNQGAPSFGRNTGLAAAQGDFVTFLDHDDTFLPTKLEELLAVMDAEKVDFICSNILLVNNRTGLQDGQAWGKVTGDSKAGFAKRLLKGNFVPPNSTLIRRRVLDTVKQFDTSLKGSDDFDFWYRIARQFPSLAYPKPLATWRYLNEKSISANDILMLKDEANFYNKIVETEGLDGQAWSQDEKEEAGRGRSRNWMYLGNRYLIKADYKQAYHYYQISGTTKMLRPLKIAPALVRQAYLFKLKKASVFAPLNLDFSQC